MTNRDTEIVIKRPGQPEITLIVRSHSDQYGQITELVIPGQDPIPFILRPAPKGLKLLANTPEDTWRLLGIFSDMFSIPQSRT